MAKIREACGLRRENSILVRMYWLRASPGSSSTLKALKVLSHNSMMLLSTAMYRPSLLVK
ncbi:hypothetical protein D9M71_504260 [compost metagenome]